MADADWFMSPSSRYVEGSLSVTVGFICMSVQQGQSGPQTSAACAEGTPSPPKELYGGALKASRLLVFANNKAGMSDTSPLDKQRQLEVIYEASRTSAYFQNEARKAQQVCWHVVSGGPSHVGRSMLG